MKDDVTHRLDAQFDTHTVVRQLHDVPPHEVYEVTVDGQRAVYKGETGPTGSAGLEGRVMAFVDEHTTVPVPEALLVEVDWYVARWHEDAPAPDEGQDADENWALAAGRGLARLHNETAPELDSYGAFQPGTGDLVDGHDEWHAAAVEYLRNRRPVLARHGHGDVAEQVIEFLEARPDAFSGTGEPVCCHGWATPEHVAVADGAVACMIDFEHAIAAPGEYDYWRTVFPAFGPEDDARNVFREGYESVRPLPDGFDRRQPLYSLLNGVYYFESLYVQDQHGPDATAEKAAQLRENVQHVLDELAE